MDYEEKYKEALEMVRRLHDRMKVLSSTDALVASSELEFIFPELAESEDVRIRKELINFLLSPFIKENLTDEKVTPWLAWLEKQKDASKAIEAVDRIDKYIDEHLANAHDMKDSNPDKKYYRGWDDALGEMAIILQDVYSGEKQKDLTTENIYKHSKERMSFYNGQQKEQKPAELNEEFVERLMDCMCAAQQYRTGTISWDVVKGWAEELNELKKPAEWSEEDKEKIVTISEIIEHCTTIPYSGGTLTLNKEYKKELLCFIKSLRPSWKPSEHQMTILKAVKDYVGKGSGYWGEALASLIEDLEKL